MTLYCVLKGVTSKIFTIMMFFLFLKVVLIFNTNIADTNEIQHYAAFHLGLHCLSKYPLWGFLILKTAEFHNEKLPVDDT